MVRLAIGSEPLLNNRETKQHSMQNDDPVAGSGVVNLTRGNIAALMCSTEGLH